MNKVLKYICPIIVSLYSAFIPAALSQNTSVLSKTVSDLAGEDVMKHASLSVCVYDIDKKSMVYSYNSQRAMTPASLTKLFTTAVGFDRLGADFRFRTTLAYSGDIDKNGTLHGDIYIIGGGDPLLGSYRYKQTVPDSLFAVWHKAIASAGIRSVDGRVYYDATIFDDHPTNDSWQWGDIGNYYGSGVSGLNFHENMFFIYFTPSSRIGYPATIDRIVPKGITVHTVNEVMTGPAKSGDQVVVYGEPASTIRTCTGTVPVDSKNFSIRASLPRPGQACSDLFTVYLRSHKIPVSGAGAEAINKPSGLTTLIEYTSPTYYVIAQYTNMTSNNLYAEAIYKYLGFKMYGLGNQLNGARVVNDFLVSNRMETSGIKLNDGCGLSVNNRVTTDFVCRFLVELSKKPYFSDFTKSLALAGENGTVRNMLTGLPNNVTVRMKTGSMTGVRAYAGYVTTTNGSRYCFSVISNDFDCTGAQMRDKLEKIIMKIATME